MSVKSYTDAQILDRVKSLDTFEGFPCGVLDVWIRSKSDEFDRFDDKTYTFECAGANKTPEFKMVCTGTTNAGQFGLKHFDTYNSSGCAVLKADTIVYESHRFGTHKGYPAYRQAKSFPYFRDNNKNDKAEEIGRERSGIILANCHRAGQYSVLIGKWSVACLVRNNRAQWDKWLEYMNKRPLTVCILKEF